MNFLNDVCNVSVATATELFLVMLSTQAKGPCHGLASSWGRFHGLQGKDVLHHPQAISPKVAPRWHLCKAMKGSRFDAAGLV